MKKYYIGKIRWMTEEEGGRKDPMPPGVVYHPDMFFNIDGNEEGWGITFISPDLDKTNLITFSFNFTDYLDYIAVGDVLNINEGPRIVAKVLVTDIIDVPSAIFDKFGISYKLVNIPQQLLDVVKDNEYIKAYLSCMGENVLINKICEGMADTYLYDVNDIVDNVFEEYNLPCLENGYLNIGCGPNGDLLCLNCKSGLVGYAFHDSLWEKTYENFDEIYVELPFNIGQFIMLAITDKEHYPVDGYYAEAYLKRI